MSGNETNCFAIRRLSPFQGCLQVIEAREARASSSNGIDWRIQVRLKPPAELPDSDRPDEGIILFGFWSSEGGFHRVPLPPLLNSADVEIAAQPIIDVLLESTGSVPFEQHDRCELWLLDERELMPLALLASCSDPQQLPLVTQPTWQPTLSTDHSFTRTPLPGEDKPAYSARDAMSDLVNQAAGQTARAQWFERQTDGSGKGIGGIHLDESLIDRTLTKDMFPQLLLREDWPEEQAQQLVNDYIEWQAPFLLTLPTLEQATRERLEPLAFKQPFKVEGQYKLYPQVIDQARLRATIIEARMRRSNPEAG